MNHKDFVNEIKRSAYSFNPNSMSKEDSIMKILEINGLNHMFSNNPTMKKQICSIVSTKLAKDGISSINQDNVEKVKDIINSCAEIKNSFEIDFKNIEPDLLNNLQSTTDSFIMNNDGSVIYSKEVVTKEYASNIQLSKSIKEETYNKHGLEIEENYQYINKDYIIDGYSLKRNDDLVTGVYTPANNNGIPCTIYVGSEHPEKMGGIRPSATEVKNHFENKEQEPGFVDYPRNPGEERQQLDTKRLLLEEYSKKSPVFRKSAEELKVYKDEMGMDK